jgi:glycosyltransferase involved in cell wall biosynthesis
VVPNLPDVWEDWAGNEPGVILVIWDASRVGWFSRPNYMCEDPSLKKFLTTAKIQRWTYTPVDAEGLYGKLAYPLVQNLLGFDRILTYGQFGERVMRKSLGDTDAQERNLSSVPHGLDPTVFYERNRADSRANFLTLTRAVSLRGIQQAVILNDEPLVGTVATNQPRKDWGLWARTCALFLSRHPKARFWIHTDKLERSPGWSIPQLLIDCGLYDRTVISLGYLNDDSMAQAYTACDLTLGIGAGEGFGFPIAESLFCGTPVLHGNYAGAVDFMYEDLLIDPVIFQPEGPYAWSRPIFDPKDWADRMEQLIGRRVNRPGQLEWDRVWPQFDAWFRLGLKRN